MSFIINNNLELKSKAKPNLREYIFLITAKVGAELNSSKKEAKQSVNDESLKTLFFDLNRIDEKI